MEIKPSKEIKVAIVHDYLRTYGGGERVLEGLHNIWPKAKIFVATADYKRMDIFGDKFKKLGIRTSWAQKIPFFVKRPLLYRFLLPLIWSSIKIPKVDVVISSSGSNIAKGVRIPKGAIHICYCHTPPRFLYALETETTYLDNPLIKFITLPATAMLKFYDRRTSDKVDLFIANSENVKLRIKKVYKKDATIVYPPCSFPKKSIKTTRGSYYLVVSRLVRYKHVDLIIRAFNKLKLPLVIIGGGKEENKLKKMASDNIQFLGQVSDKRLHEAYAECKALVVAAKDEDFGMTAVEAMGFGKPVVAFYSGGYKEIVVSPKTGIFFKRLTSKSLCDAINYFESRSFNPKAIKEYAKKFLEDNFKRRMKKIVTDVIRRRKYGENTFI